MTPASELLLPALRGRIGDWIYYVCLMRLADVSARVSEATDIHESRSLQDLIQRALTSNANRISEYLLRQEQRFLGALVVGVYGGEPEFFEVNVRQNVYLAPERVELLEMALGVLRLGGAEQLFAIDGQHRVVGIRKAVADRPALGQEEVPAIFVAHSLSRTRRLFTTLNRYAKPVSFTEKVALDEDDVVAIVARDLLDRHPLLRDRVSLAKSPNLARRDGRNFTNLPALYNSLNLYVRDQRKWADFRKVRPPDDVIRAYYSRASELFDGMVATIPACREFIQSGDATRFRNEQGGHLLFRPIGLRAFVSAVRRLCDSGIVLREALERLEGAPMELGGEPWVGLLWGARTQTMVTTKETLSASIQILIHGALRDGEPEIVDTDALRLLVADLTGQDVVAVRLPRWVDA